MGDLSVVAAFAGVEIEHGGESWSCSNVEVHEGVDFDGDDDEDEDEDMNEDEGGNGDGKRNGNWNVYATGEPHHVCAVCREHALRYLQQARPSLFAHSALMGLCKKCADMAVAKHAGPAGYDGCICAERRGTWFCFGCRVRALETVLMWREAEDDRRRGIMRVEEAVEWGGDVFVEKTVWLGLRCRCGEEVEGRVRARRCAGCEGMVVEGRPEVG